jgi:hypothetical protein
MSPNKVHRVGCYAKNPACSCCRFKHLGKSWHMLQLVPAAIPLWRPVKMQCWYVSCAVVPWILALEDRCCPQTPALTHMANPLHMLHGRMACDHMQGPAPAPERAIYTIPWIADALAGRHHHKLPLSCRLAPVKTIHHLETQLQALPQPHIPLLAAW